MFKMDYERWSSYGRKTTPTKNGSKTPPTKNGRLVLIMDLLSTHLPQIELASHLEYLVLQQNAKQTNWLPTMLIQKLQE